MCRTIHHPGFEEFPSPLTGTGPSALVRLTRQLGMPALEEAWRQVTGQRAAGSPGERGSGGAGGRSRGRSGPGLWATTVRGLTARSRSRHAIKKSPEREQV